MQKKCKRILFICPYPTGQAPSQRFRFEQYFQILKEADFKIDIAPFWSRKAWHNLYVKGNTFIKFLALVNGLFQRFVLSLQLSKYDFIFIHREATPIGPPLFEWIASRIYKKKIVYDFDDAIWIPNTSKVNDFASKVKWHTKVSSICKWSYVVSCGNRFLCDFASSFNRHVVLNPTTIDTENLHKPDSDANILRSNKIIIGWTGTHSTLKYLDPIIEVIQSLEVKYPEAFSFMVIADKEPLFKVKSLLFVPWCKKTEVKDLKKFDIGIMPLEDDLWAKGKCGFKALQYMALEIPAVVSPVGVNNLIIDHEKNGFLAHSSADWYNHLCALIENSEKRKKIGKEGRKKIIQFYSVQSNKINFLSLFDSPA